VLDETYRKAWKLDSSKFSCQFDLAQSGILSTVHDSLLQFEESTNIMEAQLYKLNVYGEFKTREYCRGPLELITL